MVELVFWLLDQNFVIVATASVFPRFILMDLMFSGGASVVKARIHIQVCLTPKSPLFLLYHAMLDSFSVTHLEEIRSLGRDLAK